MAKAGESSDGDYMQTQMLGGKTHLRRGAGGMTDIQKAVKVEREESVWQRDVNQRLKRHLSARMEGRRRGRQEKEGEGKTIGREQDHMMVATDNSDEKDMKIEKEDGGMGTTFEIGQSSRNSNRGRPSKRGKGRRRRGRGRTRQGEYGGRETSTWNSGRGEGGLSGMQLRQRRQPTVRKQTQI